jgi:hypothetical protein
MTTRKQPKARKELQQVTINGLRGDLSDGSNFKSTGSQRYVLISGIIMNTFGSIF